MDEKTIEAVKSFLRKVSRDHRIQKAFVFGSRARDDYLEESDVDILLVSDEFKGIRFPSRSAEMLKYRSFDHGDPEFLCYTPEEFARMKKKLTIVRDAVREGIPVQI